MCATHQANLPEWGIVRRVLCKNTAFNSGRASSHLECSKIWKIEAHWPNNHKAIAFPAYTPAYRATINCIFIIIIIIIIIIINNFGKSLLQLYHFLKLVLLRATTFYLTTMKTHHFSHVVRLSLTSSLSK